MLKSCAKDTHPISLPFWNSYVSHRALSVFLSVAASAMNPAEAITHWLETFSIFL